MERLLKEGDTRLLPFKKRGPKPFVCPNCELENARIGRRVGLKVVGEGRGMRDLRAVRLALCATLLIAPFAPWSFAPASAAVSPAGSGLGWTSIGPQNIGGIDGKLNAFAVVQSNPQTMYVAGGWGNTPRESPSQAGIFRTTNGGTNWTAIDNGLLNSDGTISSVVNGLWLDQSNPSVVLAATEFGGTFRSTNGGNTWTNVDPYEATQFAQAGSLLYLASLRGVIVSSDDGATWSVSLPLTPGASTVSAAGGALYAGSMSGDVYRLNGSTWTHTGHVGHGPVHDLAIDPFTPTTVYANVDDPKAWNQDLYASIDGGAHWKRVICGCSVGAQALSMSTVTKDLVYLADDGGGSVYSFAADGNPKPAIHRGMGTGGADVRYIFPFVSGKTEGCYITTDQGLQYGASCTSGGSRTLTASIQNTLAYDVSVPAGSGNVVAALQDMNGGLSNNGGATWKPIAVGEGAETFVDPYAQQNCYVAHPDEGLLISTDGCATFPTGLRSTPESLTFVPGTSTTMYMIDGADSPNAHVVVSTNLGQSFKKTGWSFTNPYQVAVSPNDPNSIVVATGTSQTQNATYYSHDGGKTWNASTGLPSAPIRNTEIYFPTHQFYVAFDQNAAGTILLADHDPSTDNLIVYRSTDNGATFAQVSTLVQPTPPRYWPRIIFPLENERPSPELDYYATRFYGNRLAFNPAASPSQTPVVVLTTRFGAFASSDVGNTWTRIDTASISHHFIGVAWDQGYVYLASFGQGVIVSSAPLQ